MVPKSQIPAFFKNQKFLFGVLALIILIYMIIGSMSAGNSGDEHFNHDHAAYVYKYIQTGGQDTSYMNPALPLQKYYGQAFDDIVYIINDVLKIDNYYTSRHILNAFTGWLLILFTGLTAALLFGWRAGLLALLLMFFSPKIVGHSWNNPKDIPFATTYTFTLYFIFRFIHSLPKIKKFDLVFITLGIASSISIRIGGLIIIPYLFLFTGIFYITQKSFYSKKGFVNALKVAGILLGISILGYFLGLLLWPYGLKDPIHNPIEALKEMTNYDVGLNQLFEGTITMSKELPWSYGLKYILITSPLVVFFGLILFFPTLLIRRNKRNEYLMYSFLIFAFAFPIAYTIYKNSNLYGGWRHLLWTYSPIVILSAGGFDYFISKNNKYIKYGTVAVLLLLLIHPVIHTFKNHPYEYIYYNQLVGGTKGAYGKYEMDYYYHSLREGADWLIENEVGEDTITVATNHYRITEYYFRKYPQVKVIYSRYYEKGKEDWDYAIWANTLITPTQLEKGYWPPKETIHTMDVDGMPIGAVVKRISHEDYEGFEALKKRKLSEAKQHFRKFLALYPENEEVLEGYSRTCLMERNLDSTLYYADKSLEYNPRQMGALLLKASALNSKKEYNEALIVANEMSDIKSDFPEGLFQKGFALKNLNQPNEALKAFQQAIAAKKEYNQAYLQMGEILNNYKNYKKAINVYDQLLKVSPNDFYANVFKAKSLQLSGDNIQAENIINGLPASNQNNVEVVKVRCRLALAKNDLGTAANNINRARYINNDADLFALRAKFVLAQNNRQQAEAFLKRAAELDPINREVQDLMKLVQPSGSPQIVQKKTDEQTKTQEQQSVMFQKPKPKKTSPIAFPKRK